jgi:hypothetical protein
MYLIQIDQVFGCRAKKGERKTKEGNLIKCINFIAPTIAEAKTEAKECIAAGEKIAPGYSAVLEVRIYRHVDWKRDCLKAVPIEVSNWL